VRLGAAGWKERYYKEKFSAETWRDIENQRKEIVSFCYHKLFFFFFFGGKRSLNIAHKVLTSVA
jgi:hypothetical protein